MFLVTLQRNVRFDLCNAIKKYDFMKKKGLHVLDLKAKRA